jgi:hypothetical protein
VGCVDVPARRAGDAQRAQAGRRWAGASSRTRGRALGTGGHDHLHDWRRSPGQDDYVALFPGKVYGTRPEPSPGYGLLRVAGGGQGEGLARISRTWRSARRKTRLVRLVHRERRGDRRG